MQKPPGGRQGNFERARQPIRAPAVIALNPDENAKEIAMKPVIRGLFLAAALAIAGCGGGSGTTPVAGPDPVGECDPANPSTHADRMQTKNRLPLVYLP